MISPILLQQITFTETTSLMKPILSLATLALAAFGFTLAGVAAAEPDRTVLPLKQPVRETTDVLDARNATPPPRFEVKAPRGAPNVVVILLDDLGFGATSAFGGPITTPTLDRLAKGGLRYNQFHTTALCSPTRTALKSGRNHHTCNMGFITELATGFPGATGEIPNAVAPLAEMLRLNGYGTGAFGKWHETASWEVSVSGPFDRWPHRQGFDKFYGFIGGETNQWAPFLHDGLSQVELPEDPNYHFMEDMADKSIAWVKHQKAMTPDRPFFMYFAPGAVHAPHHAPADWIAKWKGKFDQGWDKIREETLQRQIAMGIVPKGTALAPKPEAIKDWDKLSADEKKLFIRQVETFAAFVDYADHHIGRVIDAIAETGQLDNTLVFYIAGDNGTSAEGGMNGVFNEYSYFNGVKEEVADMLKHVDQWGGPETYPHMAAGWAVAFNSPFMWTKQVASNFGGTRVGMVAHWPKGIQAKGELRAQFSHVIDIAPTILEAARLPEPKIVNGTEQIPMEGKSLLASFTDNKAPARTTQYFEIAGNRAVYHDGWLAGVIHKAPWEGQARHTLETDVWELYHVAEDFSCANDLAAKNPDKLKELQAVFLAEAKKHHVLPIDDRFLERMDGNHVGRPDLMGARTSLTLAEGMAGMMEAAFINVKNRSKTITAEIEVPGDGGHGIILAQGGRFGGWALYINEGIPAYDYNFLGLRRTTVAGKEKLKPGKHTILLDFAYAGGGPGKGGTATLSVDGAKVAETAIPNTQAGMFSADETADVGIDLGTPVVEAIGAERKSKFTGRIPKVTVEVK